MNKLLKTFALSIGIMLISQASCARQQFYGPTTTDDRLWHIAYQTRPSSDISTQQMALAIFKANPNAFNKNINTLYTGVRLRIPSYAEVQQVTQNNAYQFIQDQNKQWQEVSNVIPQQSMSQMTPQKPSLMQQEIALLTQQLNIIKDQTESRLADLEADNDSINQRLVALVNRVNVIFDDVTKHSKIINQLVDLMDEEISSIDASLTQTIVGSIVITLFLVILWLTFSLFRRKAKPSNIDPTYEDDIEDEYDFINSEEGIPAKLDLARAYIDMENLDSALTILEEIFTEGNDEQKRIAKTLIDNIKATEAV